MIFDITGADSKTGAERTIRVSANSEREAVALAKEQGIHPYRAVRDENAESQEAQRIQSDHEKWKQQEAARKLEEQTQQRIVEIKGMMQTRLEAGKPIFLYDSIYVPVDSILNDEQMSQGFDISVVRNLGISGWEVVQAIPRTIGVGLKNTSFGSTMGDTWGGGSGGNVAGVHLVIKKSIGIDDITDDMDDEVASYIRSNFC
jgi:hypothetical protein